MSAHADVPKSIYVDHTPGLGCSDTAAGSKTTPFCTINAAVAVAGPDSHVIVAGQTGAFSVNTDSVGYWLTAPIAPRSGTAGHPVTIEAAAPGLEIDGPSGGSVFALDGVHDVVVKGFDLAGVTTAHGSSRVSFVGDTFVEGGVHLTGASDCSFIGNWGWGIVDGGSTGTLYANNLVEVGGEEITITDAPGTTIVNNTLPYDSLRLAGTSTGVTVKNNIIDDLVVLPSAVPGTVADDNHLTSVYVSGGAYSWNGVQYDQAGFVTASGGQGVHDTGGQITVAQAPDGNGFGGNVPTTPALIDSADSAAPGIQPTDALGQVPVDDPSVPDTGAGPVTHRDRGAVENTGLGSVAVSMAHVTDPAAYRTRTFQVARAGDMWAGALTYTFDFGDGHTSAPQSSPTATHTYAADGDYTVTVTATAADGRHKSTSMGVIVQPRARPDIVLASNPIASTGYYYMEVQPTSGVQTGYIPQGWYTFEWGDGTAAWTAGANFKHVLSAGHTYQDPNADPTVTLTLTDNAGWEWKWTYKPRTQQQSPAVSNPPSPGGWIVDGVPVGTNPNVPVTPTGPGNPGGGTPPPPAGNPTPPPTGSPTPPSAPGSTHPVVQRLGGSDRYATARAVSAAQWHDGQAGAVVLARGDKAPDALAGVPLAARKGGPLLLTDPTALDDATRAEIDRVLGGPATKKTIYILGGATAVSPKVEQSLRTAGYTVQRLSGSDRYGTALAVAGQFPPGKEAILATGLDFPDALAAGPLAAQRNAPIVLSDGPTVDPATTAFLHGKQTVDAVGGAAVKAAHTVSGVFVKEYAGADRFETATAVAAALAGGLGHPVNGAGVAYAFNFPDALTGGAYAAAAGQPLLLTDRAEATPATLAALHGFGTQLANVEIFGGTAVVSQAAEDQIAKAVNGTEK